MDTRSQNGISSPPQSLQRGPLFQLQNNFQSVQKSLLKFLNINRNLCYKPETIMKYTQQIESSFDAFNTIIIRLCGGSPIIPQGKVPGLVSTYSTIEHHANIFVSEWGSIIALLNETKKIQKTQREANKMRLSTAFNSIDSITYDFPTFSSFMGIHLDSLQDITEALFNDPLSVTKQVLDEEVGDWGYILQTIAKANKTHVKACEKFISNLNNLTTLYQEIRQFDSDYALFYNDYIVFEDCFESFMRKMNIVFHKTTLPAPLQTQLYERQLASYEFPELANPNDLVNTAELVFQSTEATPELLNSFFEKLRKSLIQRPMISMPTQTLELSMMEEPKEQVIVKLTPTKNERILFESKETQTETIEEPKTLRFYPLGNDSKPQSDELAKYKRCILDIIGLFPPSNVPNVELTDYALMLVKSTRPEALNSVDQVELRAGMEALYSMLCDYLKKEKQGLRANELIKETSKLLTEALNGADKTMVSSEELKKMFEVEAKGDDPRLWLPNVKNKLVAYEKSLSSLEVVNQHLDKIVKYANNTLVKLDVGSKEYDLMKDSIFKLRNDVNALATTKIDVLLFNSLSKFVSVMCSFISAITSLNLKKLP